MAVEEWRAPEVGGAINQKDRRAESRPCRSEIPSVLLGDVGRMGVKINVGTAGGLGVDDRVGGFVVLEQTGKFEFGGELVPECGHPLAHREDGVVEICVHRTGEDDARIGWSFATSGAKVAPADWPKRKRRWELIAGCFPRNASAVR